MCIIYLRLFHQYVIVHVDLFVVPAAILIYCRPICMLRVASTMGESLIWQPAIYLANKFSLFFLSLSLSFSNTAAEAKY